MDRQGPAHPPPAPWTIQPSHPELLNALAGDFRRSHHDLRHLFKVIVNSTACQRSSTIDGPRTPQLEDDLAVHIVRRLRYSATWLTGSGWTYPTAFPRGRPGIKLRKGSRLESLLKAKPAKTDEEIVEELFLATIDRFPAAQEKAMAVKLFTTEGCAT